MIPRGIAPEIGTCGRYFSPPLPDFALSLCEIARVGSETCPGCPISGWPTPRGAVRRTVAVTEAGNAVTNRAVQLGTFFAEPLRAIGVHRTLVVHHGIGAL